MTSCFYNLIVYHTCRQAEQGQKGCNFTSASHCACRIISSGGAVETDLTTPTLTNTGRNQPVNRHSRTKAIRLSAAVLFLSVQLLEMWQAPEMRQDGAGQRARQCQQLTHQSHILSGQRCRYLVPNLNCRQSRLVHTQGENSCGKHCRQLITEEVSSLHAPGREGDHEDC